jgi:hypothetical protein
MGRDTSSAKIAKAAKKSGGFFYNITKKGSSAVTDGVLESLDPMLKATGHFATFVTGAYGVYALTKTLIAKEAMDHFKKLAVEVSETLKSLCEAAQVSVNLAHQKDFPQWVYHFVSDEVAKVASGEDLEPVNSNSLLGRIKLLGKAEPQKDSSNEKETKAPPQYFFVYHPGSDWHAAFNNMIRQKPIPGFVGATNNLNLLGHYLDQFRSFVGPEAVINILFPSAHVYVIEDDINVDGKLHPIRFTGQKHYSGTPFVHMCAIGMDETNVTDLKLLPKYRGISAGRKVGIAAGGIGAGIGGAIAGGALVVGVVTLGAVFAGPAILAGAAAEAVILGGTAAGFLGGGAAAGTLAGIQMTEDARLAAGKKQIEKKK